MRKQTILQFGNPLVPAKLWSLSSLAFAMLVALTGCSPQSVPSSSADVTRQQDLRGFPYHPLVFHLDLSILAYQLYAQTLVWPFDPYYEEFEGGEVARSDVMGEISRWASYTGAQQTRLRPSIGGYRGPGRLAGFADNPSHDPIIYRYDVLNPWSSTISNSGGRWVEYLTPKKITAKIGSVHMCYRRTGQPEGDVAVKLIARQPGEVSGARDVLLAFEGGTGDKGEAGQPVSQSLMGFALLRHSASGDGFDVHIAFRGSRSGSLVRVVRQAFSDSRARGNPDWITDLGFDMIGRGNGAGAITATGKVHRGFAHSLKWTLPQVFGCLEKLAALKSSARPNNIYVTGHSLGGGMAQHFASAVLLGNRYGPDGKGAAMPGTLRRWPWDRMKLITFSAPRAGDDIWAKTLTEKGLASEFHESDLKRFDPGALSVGDASILPRLVDPSRPAGYRVLMSTDPITSNVVLGRRPVGKTVYVDNLGPLAVITPHSPSSHEPSVVRQMMVESLADPRIPNTAWRYRERANLSTKQGETTKPILADHEKLAAEMKRYYQENRIRFNIEAFARDFDILDNILSPLPPPN